MHYGWSRLRQGLIIVLVIMTVSGTVGSTLYPRLQISLISFSLRSSTLDGSIIVHIEGDGLFVPEAANVMLGESPLLAQIETNQTMLHLPGNLELHVMGVGSTTSDTVTIAIAGVWAAFGSQATTPVYVTVEQPISWVNSSF
jgi:hypothetical protein